MNCVLVYFCIPETGALAKLCASYFHRLSLTLEVLFQRESLVPPPHYQLLHVYVALPGMGLCIGNGSNGAGWINSLSCAFWLWWGKVVVWADSQGSNRKACTVHVCLLAHTDTPRSLSASLPHTPTHTHYHSSVVLISFGVYLMGLEDTWQTDRLFVPCGYEDETNKPAAVRSIWLTICDNILQLNSVADCVYQYYFH